MTKKRKISFVDDVGEDWENRLAFIDGEFDDTLDLLEEAGTTEDLKSTVASALSASKITPRATKKTERPRTQEQTVAQRTVTRTLTQLTNAALKSALPQIALKLSQEARRAMKRVGGRPRKDDIELVAEYLRQTAGTFELVSRFRDAAYFRLMLIAWLTENGGTAVHLKEALSLIPSTDSMFDPVADAISRKKLVELKSEVRRLLQTPIRKKDESSS